MKQSHQPEIDGWGLRELDHVYLADRPGQAATIVGPAGSASCHKNLTS